jgi:putative aldouronate transport system permease protein
MDLHEAAMVDGANKLQRTLHIDISGHPADRDHHADSQSRQIMSIGFEKAYLMQNTLISPPPRSYRRTSTKSDCSVPSFSFSTAIGCSTP